ncbi:sensor histidine kinase [Pygmaiobacter massiliensis]|uniref:sensor histidine kinase n=1 Tax=Pygmaiobacter massiliensis TaxID=1917873 RepID=UPI002A809F16|nr:sensor histidine kinase [Pygmaiobacter massiliensis]MDY4785751.1 sensor histidine kinase [Pygmaiobacter massiliensis]
MKDRSSKSIRAQILSVNLVGILLTLGLALVITLGFTLRQDRRALDENIRNSAMLLAQVPEVVRTLENQQESPAIKELLDAATVRIRDIDLIILADLNGIQYYAPDQEMVGTAYVGKDQKRILDGEEAFVSDDTGPAGADHCAYAPVRAKDGTLLGFVVVGIYARSYAASAWHTVLRFVLITLAAGAVGVLLSFKLSNRIKASLLGYEPSRLVQLFQQREEVLEALEEGILAIDSANNIIYINRAAARMIGVDREQAMGQQLHAVYPASTLDRVAASGVPEYNVSLSSRPKMYILADRMPIREGQKIIGAVAIFRNRTEVRKLAENLTGVRHMVEAMRAYTHEFMNKLHVILGLLQIGEPQRAEEYIMNITQIQREVIGLIMERIQEPSAAALLVGKTSRCAELGIRLILDNRSHLSKECPFLPADAYVTILGNLIENAIDGLNQTPRGLKEITVSIREEAEELRLYVDDTGPGISPEAQKLMFQRGFSTKGPGRGTGLKLVQEVVEACHGAIRVESELGIGTTFFLTFNRPMTREGE